MSLNLLDRQCHNVAKHRHCSTWLLFFIYLYLVLKKSVIYSCKCGEKTSEISNMKNVLPSSSQALPQLIVCLNFTLSLPSSSVITLHVLLYCILYVNLLYDLLPYSACLVQLRTQHKAQKMRTLLKNLGLWKCFSYLVILFIWN